MTYDRNQNRATWVERDVLKNNEVMRRAQVDIPHCVHDVLGGILALRGLTIEPGQSAQVPMSDGRRAAQVKVDAQEREEVITPAGTFKTIRYEANLMNGVVYPAQGAGVRVGVGRRQTDTGADPAAAGVSDRDGDAAARKGSGQMTRSTVCCRWRLLLLGAGKRAGAGAGRSVVRRR